MWRRLPLTLATKREIQRCLWDYSSSGVELDEDYQRTGASVNSIQIIDPTFPKVKGQPGTFQTSGRRFQKPSVRTPRLNLSATPQVLWQVIPLFMCAAAPPNKSQSKGRREAE